MTGKACLVLSVVAAFCAAGAPADQGDRFLEVPGVREFSGQMIARPVQPQTWRQRGLAAAAAARRVAAARQALAGYELREYVAQTDEYVFLVPAGQSENDVADALLASGNFAYVEPNWIVYPLGCPDDPRFGNQWHHNANRLQSCDGWEIHSGEPATSIGICDTGIRTTHEDLQLHRLEGYNAVDRRWESEGGRINDLHGHGTKTTGCAAANGNNGKGVSGVGWDLSHRMLRVSNSSSGSTDLATLQHAARTAVQNGDRVANVSYSGVYASSNRTTASYIKSIGGLLFWSAGNDGAYLNWGDRDADDLLVIGGTNQSDGKAWFSAYGPSVDLVAPAVDIYTTAYNYDSAYGYDSGTSFASPLAAGLATLLWSYNPGLTPDEVETLLKQGCDDLGASGVDNIYGYGRINLYQTLSLAGPGIPGDLDRDGCVDQTDLGILLGSFGVDDGGDVDGDGDTDQSDLGILLAHWGEGC